jgi:hypothetical protein
MEQNIEFKQFLNLKKFKTKQKKKTRETNFEKKMIF